MCGVHMAESLLVGRNFVSGVCKVKPNKNLKKNLKPVFFCFKNLGFYQLWQGLKKLFKNKKKIKKITNLFFG